MSKTIDKAEQTALELVGKLPSLMLKSATTPDSLIEFSKPTRVEPIVMVDRRVMDLQQTSDVMHALCSIFSGYYLQAVALTNNVGGVNVINTLDSLNPRRELLGNYIRTTTEGQVDKLPRPNADKVSLEGFGLESKPGDLDKLISDAHNLSVGKYIEVSITDGKQSATIPVNVRLAVNGIDSELMTHTLAAGSKDNSVKERFHAWRSGQLKFIRDLVFCQDLIDGHRKSLAKDKSNHYAETLKRRNKNRLASVFSGKMSVATASNIYVMSDTTRKELEQEVKGRLSDFKVRERIFKETYGMLMVVIDPEWDQVTIYHRSLEDATELSMKDIKSANRGTGPDVMEILKAYQLGATPSI